jgi:hypothetical protein
MQPEENELYQKWLEEGKPNWLCTCCKVIYATEYQQPDHICKRCKKECKDGPCNPDGEPTMGLVPLWEGEANATR